MKYGNLGANPRQFDKIRGRCVKVTTTRSEVQRVQRSVGKNGSRPRRRGCKA